MDRFDKIEAKIDKITEEISEIKISIAKLEALIKGNGGFGLETEIKEIKDELNRQKKIQDKLVIFIIILFIITFTLAGFASYKPIIDLIKIFIP
jgi:predicted translin family RNA/ssDNA-binding protein